MASLGNGVIPYEKKSLFIKKKVGWRSFTPREVVLIYLGREEPEERSLMRQFTLTQNKA
jgi:hypothetical protein